MPSFRIFWVWTRCWKMVRSRTQEWDESVSRVHQTTWQRAARNLPWKERWSPHWLGRERDIKCAFEIEEYCSACKDHACVKKCLENLVEKTEECRVAFYEKESFECGIDFEVECGKSRKLGPIELVHCIEERHPCDPKNWILLSTSRFSIPLQRSCFIKIRIAVGGECLLWLSVMQQVIGACMSYYSYQNNGRA